jgi:phytoene dehydrogenase-like protein
MSTPCSTAPGAILMLHAVFAWVAAGAACLVYCDTISSRVLGVAATAIAFLLVLILFGPSTPSNSASQLQFSALDEEYDRSRLGTTATVATEEAAAPGVPNRRDFYPTKSSTAATVSQLCTLHPEYDSNIRSFYRLAERTVGCFDVPTYLLKLLPMWLARLLETPLGWICGGGHAGVLGMSTAQVLEKCGIPEGSRCAGRITHHWPDTGCPPSEQPFLVFAKIASRQSSGMFFPRGGGSVLPAALVSSLVATGRGTFRVRAPVDELLVGEGGCVEGVRVKGAVKVKAPVVISAAGAYNTLVRMMPLGAPKAVVENAEFAALRAALVEGGKGEQNSSAKESLPLSSSWLSLFVGLDVPTEELGIPKANQWMFPSWDHSKNVKKAYEAGPEAEFPAVFITSSSAKDDSYNERRRVANAQVERLGEGKTCPGGSFCVLALIDFRWFSKFVDPSHRDSISPVSARAVAREQTKLSEEYSLLKDEMKARLLKALVDVYPQVEKHISLADLSTPVTMNRFIGTTRGEFNGLHHGSNRFSARTQRMLRPQMPITGLYLTGQDITSQTLFEAMKAGALTVTAVSWLVFFQCFGVLWQDGFLLS